MNGCGSCWLPEAGVSAAERTARATQECLRTCGPPLPFGRGDEVARQRSAPEMKGFGFAYLQFYEMRNARSGI
jgi:hypothetical protein